MSFDLTCPRCGCTYTVPADLQQATFKGNRMNVVAPCPACGHEFDATGGGDGTFSVVGQRLERVAQVLAGASREDVARIQADVRKIADQQDQAAAITLARDLGWEPPSAAKSRLTTGNEALEFLIKLQVVLAMLVAGGVWSVETVTHLLDQWMR